jgi:hypothetical protein
MALFAWNFEAHAWQRLKELSDLASIPRRESTNSWLVIDLDLTEEEELAASLTWLRLYGRVERKLYQLVEMAGSMPRGYLLACAAGRDNRNVGYLTKSLNGLVAKRALFESHGTLTCNPIVPPEACKPQQTACVDKGRSYIPIAEQVYRMLEANAYLTPSQMVSIVFSQALGGIEPESSLLPPLAKGKRDRRKEMIMRELKRLMAEKPIPNRK